MNREDPDKILSEKTSDELLAMLQRLRTGLGG